MDTASRKVADSIGIVRGMMPWYFNYHQLHIGAILDDPILPDPAPLPPSSEPNILVKRKRRAIVPTPSTDVDSDDEDSDEGDDHKSNRRRSGSHSQALLNPATISTQNIPNPIPVPAAAENTATLHQTSSYTEKEAFKSPHNANLISTSSTPGPSDRGFAR